MEQCNLENIKPPLEIPKGCYNEGISIIGSIFASLFTAENGGAMQFENQFTTVSISSSFFENCQATSKTSLGGAVCSLAQAFYIGFCCFMKCIAGSLGQAYYSNTSNRGANGVETSTSVMCPKNNEGQSIPCYLHSGQISCDFVNVSNCKPYLYGALAIVPQSSETFPSFNSICKNTAEVPIFFQFLYSKRQITAEMWNIIDNTKNNYEEYQGLIFAKQATVKISKSVIANNFYEQESSIHSNAVVSFEDSFLCANKFTDKLDCTEMVKNNHLNSFMCKATVYEAPETQLSAIALTTALLYQY